MTYMQRHGLNTQELIKPNTIQENKDAYTLFHAYIANIEVAQQLSNLNTPLYQDCWLALNLSIECFFKYAYLLCISILEKHSKIKKQEILGPIEYDSGLIYYHKSIKNGKHVNVKDFDHEVMELWMFFDRLTTAHNHNDFQKLKNHIPTKSDWINARYSIRNHQNYKDKYLNYLLIFQEVQKNVFKGIL